MSNENEKPITEKIAEAASNAYEAVKETAAKTIDSASKVLDNSNKDNS